MTEKKDGIGSMIKLGLTLAIFAVASCTVLALVNNVTSPVIKENNIRKANEAMKAVFPDADAFELPDIKCGTTKSGKTTIDSIHLAKKGGETVGAVVQISGPTYDRSTIMVGLDMTGTVTGMQYLENTDTPGFGQKGSDPTFKLSSGKTFYGQFTLFDSFRGF
ncbi:MAG: FMN-binding protein, partial [Treponema sp.]|nr:FMN-binding protein [Treponema sp.]MBP5753607.1 FMN-binding protein [Treponema sp.]